MLADILRASVEKLRLYGPSERRPAARSHRPFAIETLEAREVPTVSMTGYEQLLVDLINRARINPAAEAQRHGIDLNQGLSPGKISSAPKPVLAPHQALIDAAVGHSQDMLAQNYFDHRSLDGRMPWDRARATGYPSTYVGENISSLSDYGTIDYTDAVWDMHAELFHSPPHRENMLSSRYIEIGTGVRFQSSGGWQDAMLTENFGDRESGPLVTGIVYKDSNANNRYDVGEGLAGVTVSAGGQSTTTGPSGGWVLSALRGKQTIVATGGAFTGSSAVPVDIGSDNIGVDFVSGLATGYRNYQLVPQTLQAPAVLGPTAFYTMDRTPTIDWSSVSGANRYDLWVSDISANPTVTVLRNESITGTSLTMANSLTVGHRYRVWVRSLDASGNASAWSANRDFVVVDPTAPLVTGPSFYQMDRTPTITWQVIGGAARYDLYVSNVTPGSEGLAIREQNLTGTSFTPAADLTPGRYRIWIRSFNEAGIASPWSPNRDFIVSQPPVAPSQPAITFATGATKPKLTWNAASEAVRFEVYVSDLTTGVGPVLRVTDVSAKSFTFSDPLVRGHRYRVWIRAFNRVGEAGAWSRNLDFTIA